VIVLYATREGNGHSSPLIGRRNGRVLLPYDDDGSVAVDAFRRAWGAPGILHPCVVIDRGSLGVL
jgi:hypothetical protein